MEPQPHRRLQRGGARIQSAPAAASLETRHRRWQYQIGDAEHWQQIVDNLAALVAELGRSFVPAIEAAAGPSPEWYRPES